MATTFARVAGWIFIVLGILGFFVNNLFGLIQFDVAHNAVHLLLGVLGLAAASGNQSQLYSAVVGAVLVILGAAGFFLPSMLGIHLEPVENILHLVLGGWGLYAGVYKKG
ncbi:DUF4383 domain-containing protein [Effusibacillus lacus]|uniref:DUF4383 domain-containing protein n=1 Tax=Effusibacillus lacus TaxID=1348429 RepID=A0A292YL10_9BACL|nr:DUF4383 domain-containing protein [Effusibacillus lacus]TCS70631.1 uncharacterized protein DUF4383 [Effusibacillus lacus]GAX90628.1 hypothetical protein [Effusibacillus lacus]